MLGAIIIALLYIEILTYVSPVFGCCVVTYIIFQTKSFAQKYLKQLRTPKEVKLNGDPVSVTNPSFFLRPMVHTASSKTCLVSKPTKSHQPTKPSPDQSKIGGCGQKKVQDDSVGNKSRDQRLPDSEKSRSMGPNLYIALAAAHFKLSEKKWKKENKTVKYVNTHVHNICKYFIRLFTLLDYLPFSFSSSAKRKQQRECLAKLKSVYAILCCLHNIKMKDLRCRVS